MLLVWGYERSDRRRSEEPRRAHVTEARIGSLDSSRRIRDRLASSSPRGMQSAKRFLLAQGFQTDEPADRARLEGIKSEAIAYLRRHFEFPIPKPVAAMSVEEILLLASSKGHRQLCACTILKAMHIIHHLDGRELLYSIPMADQDVFHLVEEKVYRVIGGMLAAGFPITEFIGGRKNKDSLYTKLLSKADTTAAAIYDKLRFRIVTRSADDILPILLYLSEDCSRSTTSCRAKASTRSSTFEPIARIARTSGAWRVSYSPVSMTS